MAGNYRVCRTCKEKIDIRVDEYVMPVRNMYYHKNCYKNWFQIKASLPKLLENEEQEDQEGAPNDKDFWLDKIYRIHVYEYHAELNFKKTEQQLVHYMNTKKYTAKGIYYTVRYMYEVANGDITKNNGGIGLVPYYYSKAVAYYAALYVKGLKLSNVLKEQMEAFKQRNAVKEVRYVKPPEKKAAMSLDEIDALEDTDD